MIWNFLKKSKPIASHPAKAADCQATKIQLPVTFLQKLIPIGELSVAELQGLPISAQSFNPGDIIFNCGDSDDSLSYLYSGEVFLEAANGRGYSVEESIFKACYPLSTGNAHRFTAIAKSATRIIYLPQSALQRGASATNSNQSLVNPQHIPSQLKGSRLFDGFCVAYRKDDLHVPSLPDIALRLRSALQKEIGIAEAAKIINLDPAIASKLIQVANSPLYSVANPTGSCHDAINRLGFKTTQNLVTSISLHNLFRSRNKKLNERIQLLWKQSIHIASLSHTLAALTGKANADEALLAGLIHNIGALPLITFAETLSDGSFSDQELDQSIEFLQGLVGEYILKKWHFPDSLLKIPCQSNNWYYDSGHDRLDLNDIVLLARFHSLLGNPHRQLPPLNTLPAFIKLGDTALTPDLSLQILHDAKQHIAEALNFFKT